MEGRLVLKRFVAGKEEGGGRRRGLEVVDILWSGREVLACGDGGAPAETEELR